MTKNKKLTKKRKTSLSFVIELIVFHLLHLIPPIDQSCFMLSLSGSCICFKDRLLGKRAEKRCDFSKAILLHTVVCEICCLVLSVSWRFSVVLEVLVPGAIWLCGNLGLVGFSFMFLIFMVWRGAWKTNSEGLAIWGVVTPSSRLQLLLKNLVFLWGMAYVLWMLRIVSSWSIFLLIVLSVQHLMQSCACLCVCKPPFLLWTYPSDVCA